MPAIRQQINIATTPRAVWKALTTNDGLTSWWVDEARVDGRAGGRITLISEDDDGNPVEERGMFHAFRPTRKIEIAWDKNSPAVSKGSYVEFTIGKDGDETRVMLIHSGSSDMFEDEEQNASLAKAWKAALKALRSSLED